MSLNDEIFVSAKAARPGPLSLGLCPQGCQATICMPPTTTAIKIEAVKRLGGDIELVGQTYAEAQTHARVSPL